MDRINEHIIFFQEKHSTNIEDAHRGNDCVQSIPYLKKGDSNIYVDQFLAKEEEKEPEPMPKVQSAKEESSPPREADESYQVGDSVQFNPSAFHNFQKHLTVCLKHAINITLDDSAVPEYQIAAARLWKTFKNSAVSTKKVLHYLLGAKNEHPITEAGKKQYGLHKIYELYGSDTMKEARVFLANQTLRQIREGQLQTYITAKKLKDKEKFKRYVQIFVRQLEEGFLRKRLPKDRVNFLIGH